MGPVCERPLAQAVQPGTAAKRRRQTALDGDTSPVHQAWRHGADKPAPGSLSHACRVMPGTNLAAAQLAQTDTVWRANWAHVLAARTQAQGHPVGVAWFG